MIPSFRAWRQLLALAPLYLSACQTPSDATELPMPQHETVLYRIPQGSHYATSNPFRQRSLDHLSFEVRFDSTAIYTSADPGNQGDINKLYGLSDCGSTHQSNSARFGWRWYNQQLEIHAYVYVNQQRHSALIGTLPLGTSATCRLTLGEQEYTFELNGKQVKLPRNCSGTGEGYQLYPYFGGDEVAPHDVTIAIKELD